MKPLEGVVILDFTRVTAGPYVSMILADFGADVIKIEMPGTGDDSRAFGPFINSESLHFMALNRGKRSLTLDCRQPEAQQIVLEMVKQVDVVLENYRPGTMEKWGLGYDNLKAINPKLVYASASGYGQTGPYAQKPAYDVVVQGRGGIMSINGFPDGPPCKVAISQADITAGLFTTIGVMLALFHRAVRGVGEKVDVAMLDCQVALLENVVNRHLCTGIIPGQLGNDHWNVAPFGPFTAKDGWIILTVGNRRLWETFCTLITRPDLLTDSRFLTNDDRHKNRFELKKILDKVFNEKKMAEWLDILEDAGIPCGPINTIDKVVEDPQVKAREMIVEVTHPLADQTRLVGTPIKLSHHPATIEKPAPILGAHTDQILGEFLGMSLNQIEQLRAKKVI